MLTSAALRRTITAALCALAGCIGLDASALSVEVGLAFTGWIANQGLGAPPDTMGAVGEDHIVELLNSGYSVYDKQDGSLLERHAPPLDQFWAAAGVTVQGFSFDPRVIYDPAVRRWFAVAVDGGVEAGAPKSNRLLVAVSEDADPTTGWTGVAIDIDPTDTRWADFPQIGLDADALYVSTVMFPVATATRQNAFVVLPKQDLVAPTPTVSGASIFRAGTGVSGFEATPVVDLDGGNGPADFYAATLTFAGQIQTSRIDGPADAPIFATGGFMPVEAIGAPPTANQPGPKPNLDTGGSGFRSGAVRRNGVDWTVQSVDVDGRAAVRWLQIDPENDIVLDSGVIADPTLDLFYPSIAVNEFDEIVIGMSGSSETDFAGAYAVAGAKVGGVTTFGDLMLLKAGEADYQRLKGNPPRNRWGDYSATVTDPADPHHFWTFQEYVYSEDTQAIWIAELIAVPECATSMLLASGLAVLASRRRGRA